MFTRAVFVLTLWYVLALAVLCTGFSVTLYRSSTRQLDGIQRRQEQIIKLQAALNPPLELTQLDDERLQAIKDAKQEVATELAWLDLGILSIGAALSYLLARRTLRPIEQNMEIQTRFSADASHELRTPLTALKTELEVALRDTKLTFEESKELHRSALEEVDKLQQLTASLLSLNEPRQQVAKEIIDVETAIQAAINETPAGKSSFSVKVQHNIGYGRHSALVQILKILLNNAVKYGPENGGEILISSTLEGHFLNISIADHGIGIDEGDVLRIFDRFYRANAARSRIGAGGYGLGLAIAKSVAERNGASLSVQSRAGQGSVFTITLKAAGTGRLQPKSGVVKKVE